jgi:hypothetical protein
MYDDMYIPWTPRSILRKPAPEEAQPQQPAAQAAPKVCTRTLHIARAIMAYAVEPFPEAARAISAAFAAYIRGALDINITGDPHSWAVVPLNNVA